jgi:hypothetical protein
MLHKSYFPFIKGMSERTEPQDGNRRMEAMERLLTFKEAQELGFGSHYSLRRWARIGRISVVRLGARTLRLRQADLEAFVKDNIQPAREGSR